MATTKKPWKPTSNRKEDVAAIPTMQELIEYGELIDVSHHAAEMLMPAPTTFTIAAWTRYVAAGPNDGECEPGAYETDRVRVILSMVSYFFRIGDPSPCNFHVPGSSEAICLDVVEHLNAAKPKAIVITLPCEEYC